MKNFEKIVQEVLNCRQKIIREQNELAEEILEKMIKSFSDFNVKYITLFLSKKEKRIIIIMYGKDSNEIDQFSYEELYDGERVLEHIKYMLQDVAIIKNKFDIKFLNNSECNIRLKICY